MKQDMRKYILRKLIELIFTLLFVTLLSFLLMRLSSVDPATAYAKRMIGNPTAPDNIFRWGGGVWTFRIFCEQT